VQCIYDLEVPRMVFGRTVILGDGAFFVRPHMAAGTSKAGADGLRLAEAPPTNTSMGRWTTGRGPDSNSGTDSWRRPGNAATAT